MEGRGYRFVTWLLALALVASVLGAMAVAVSPPTPTEPYTEFYVLDDDGDAEGYPTNLTVGQSGTVIVGISNHEHRDRTYTVALALENRTLTSRTVPVESERTKELSVSFSPTDPGRKTLYFRLYRGDNASGPPYRRLRLLLNVTETSR
ncbi:DUF1616 domain-containing protein [Halorussus caseinilyticus]|uniref:DUF1616 domain-containing protein n=1 Tax=Halorussus caseinilyticus TaxID=3034025 RepID=A0ABD5WLM1_9EURY|nr:DUF1616 domain-containing protein [Halorussus sp. DT72]